MEQHYEPRKPNGSQQTNNQNTQPEHPVLTLRQQQKQDALKLAELIYDIFKDSLSSATIEVESIKEKNNV